MRQQKAGEQKGDMKYKCVCYHDENVKLDIPGTNFRDINQSQIILPQEFLGLFVSRPLLIIRCLNTSKVLIGGAGFSCKGMASPNGRVPRKSRGSCGEYEGQYGCDNGIEMSYNRGVLHMGWIRVKISNIMRDMKRRETFK